MSTLGNTTPSLRRQPYTVIRGRTTGHVTPLTRPYGYSLCAPYLQYTAGNKTFEWDQNTFNLLVYLTFMDFKNRATTVYTYATISGTIQIIQTVLVVIMFQLKKNFYIAKWKKITSWKPNQRFSWIPLGKWAIMILTTLICVMWDDAHLTLLKPEQVSGRFKKLSSKPAYMLTW